MEPEPNPSTGDATSPERLCAAFVDALHVTGASISVFGRDGRQSTIRASDRIAARGDSLQLELGEGPHWEALSTGVPVLCPDLSAQRQRKWPVFSAAALEIGMVGVFAFPMKMGAAIVGVVDLYTASARHLDKHQVSLATSMAGRAAASAVRYAMNSAEQPSGAEHGMAPALRREVHQATGMLQNQLDVSATEAFTRLRAHAYSSERPIEDIAHDIVRREFDFSIFTD